MAVYFTNSFSLNMLKNARAVIKTHILAHTPVFDARCGHVWAFGHADIAAIAAKQCGPLAPTEPARVSISLELGDVLFVLQYNGPRLPEGTTQLPEGAKVEWRVVYIE